MPQHRASRLPSGIARRNLGPKPWPQSPVSQLVPSIEQVFYDSPPFGDVRDQPPTPTLSGRAGSRDWHGCGTRGDVPPPESMPATLNPRNAPCPPCVLCRGLTPDEWNIIPPTGRFWCALAQSSPFHSPIHATSSHRGFLSRRERAIAYLMSKGGIPITKCEPSTMRISIKTSNTWRPVRA